MTEFDWHEEPVPAGFPVRQVHGWLADETGPDGDQDAAVSRSAQPNRECRQAMPSVCTTADPATASRSLAARVVLPLELRPSTASTTGR
jgi:hypothetical protein